MCDLRATPIDTIFGGHKNRRLGIFIMGHLVAEVHQRCTNDNSLLLSFKKQKKKKHYTEEKDRHIRRDRERTRGREEGAQAPIPSKQIYGLGRFFFKEKVFSMKIDIQRFSFTELYIKDIVVFSYIEVVRTFFHHCIYAHTPFHC